ncbi:MAG TPA: glycosyltransferase family 39 protein [Flavobacteriales bacterium]|nr:glycosyltransferase family 39 protein [Flavobacteriales bacterium]
MNARLAIPLALVAAAMLLFVPGLGAVHLFDWDEINFAEISREMLLLDDYSRVHVDFRPFWEKPPLFFWMQVGAMELFGVGEFAARLPNALCGVVTLLVLFRIGRRLHGTVFGGLWALAYLGSVLPHLYFRSGIIDPWFNLFIFLGIDQFIQGAWARRDRTGMAGLKHPVAHLTLAGAFLGLAMLTKGQVAFMLFAATAGIYWLLQRFRMFVSVSQVALLLLVMVAVTGAWFGYETWKNGPWFVTEFVRYQYRLFSTPDAGHAGFPGYHFVVLLVGCFPLSLFAIAEMARRKGERTFHEADYRRWMLILFWVVLILFTIVKSKIVHYSSMCYFPMSYLAALYLHRIWQGEAKAGLALRIGLGVIGGLFVLITVALPIAGMDIDSIRPLFAQDPFAMANLDADVTWTGWETLAGIWLAGILAFSLCWLAGRDVRWGILTLFSGTALFVTLTLMFFINKIEGYSQRAAIEFFEERQGETCYVLTKNYRSYAHLFYTRKPPVTDRRAWDEEWLFHGDIDRPVYLVCKVTAVEETRAIDGFREIGARNGFHFFKREVP